MMELRLSRSVLRPWRAGDEPAIVRHANNRNIWLNLRDRFPHPYTMADAVHWVQTAAGVEAPTDFAIVIEDEPVGGIGLMLKGDVYRRSAEIGYWLGEAYWGRGIVSEAARAVTRWGFANYDLTRIYARVFSWNLASARVLEKAGYTFEARLRRSVTKEDRTGDELVYAVLWDEMAG
jgi:RimJ/RimL family protein N-acetyltransferase